ncbi:MAG: hypothetical protein MJZ22_00505 [Candidatus Saccharibacteria bacterium]|nr:hypothetical protein [Candidatus Saccharibacteria bacterium]
MRLDAPLDIGYASGPHNGYVNLLLQLFQISSLFSAQGLYCALVTILYGNLTILYKCYNPE